VSFFLSNLKIVLGEGEEIHAATGRVLFNITTLLLNDTFDNSKFRIN
jgi:hypothetical protein